MEMASRDERWVQLVRWPRAPASAESLARWRDGVFVILRPEIGRCSGDMRLYTSVALIGSRSSHLLTSQQ